MSLLDNIQPQIQTISLWLHDTYAQIHPKPLHDLLGITGRIPDSNIYPNTALLRLLDNLEKRSDNYTNDIFYPNSGFFLNGGDIFNYLAKNIDHGVCDATITLVIISLRDIYC